MNVTAQVELSIHPQEICFITNLKEEDIIYPPAVTALTVTATDAPLQRKWEQETKQISPQSVSSSLSCCSL